MSSPELTALAESLRELGRVMADEGDILSAEELAELREIARTTDDYKPGNKQGRFVLHLLRGVRDLDARLADLEEIARVAPKTGIAEALWLMEAERR